MVDTYSPDNAEAPDAPGPSEAPQARIPGTDEPTPSFVASWFARQWRAWRKRRDLDQAIRDRVYRVYVPDPTGPNGEGGELRSRAVRSGVLKTLGREFVGITTSNEPKIEALQRKLGPKFEDERDQIEQWARAWRIAVGGADLEALIDGDAVFYGRGVSYVEFVRQYWADMPKDGADDDDYTERVEDFKRDAPLPIIEVHCPAPQTMYDEDEWSAVYGPPNAVYWCHRPLSEIAEKYPKSKAAKRWRDLLGKAGGKFPDDPYRLFVCFSNRQYKVYAVADGAAMVEPETESQPVALLSDAIGEFEFVQAPYEHGLGKNAFEVQEGDKGADNELVHRVSGLFDNSLDLIDRIDETLTQYFSAVSRYSRAQPVVTREWGPGGVEPYGIHPETKAPREIKWNPDRVLQFGPGERPGWWTPDLSSYQSAIELHNLLSQYVQRDTLAPSSWGAGTATESGYHMVTLIQAAERKLKPLMRRKARAREGIIHRAFALVAYIDDPDGVPVKYSVNEDGPDGATEAVIENLVYLKPRVAEKARVRVTVKPRLDSAKIANTQMGLQIAQVAHQGMIQVDPNWIAEEWLDIPNPAYHAKKSLISEFMRHPDVKSWVMRQVLAEADLLLKAEDQQQAAALAGLDPLQLALVPGALQQVLAARGLMAGSGAIPGAGTGDGGTNLMSLMSQVAPPTAPGGGMGGNVPGMPSNLSSTALAGNAGRPPVVPGIAQAAQGLAQFGQPASIAQGART